MLNEQAPGTASRKSLHGQWSSRFAFILAVTGSAVGLGNIWKFPYIAGQNGGGAFVLVYLLCVVLIGMPVMMSEILLGRRGRRNPVATMALLGEEEGGSLHAANVHSEPGSNPSIKYVSPATRANPEVRPSAVG